MICEETGGEMKAEDIQASIYQLERQLVQAELDERGAIEFMWNGAAVKAAPVERPHGRGSNENYWRAQVGSKSLEFRSTAQRPGAATAWDAYTGACHAHRDTHGSSPQEAADRMFAVLTGFQDELKGFFEHEGTG